MSRGDGPRLVARHGAVLGLREREFAELGGQMSIDVAGNLMQMESSRLAAYREGKK